MDRHLLFPNSLTPNNKLSRAASFSDFSSADKVIIKKSYQLQTNGNLTKQYSCEQIFDQNSNTSQVKFSKLIRSQNEEHKDFWETTVPVSNSFWSIESNKPLCLQDKLSSLNHKLALTGMNSNDAKTSTSPFMLSNKGTKLKPSTFNFKSSINEFKTKAALSEQSLKYDSIKSNNEKSEDVTNNVMTNNINASKVLKEIPSINKSKENDSIADLKKRLRSLVVEKPKKKRKMYLSCSFIFMMILSGVIGYIAFIVNNTDVFKELCSPKLNINNLHQDLNRYIYGQNYAVHDLIQFFTKKDNHSGFDALVFIGGIGVGKSYTAEIVKNNLKDTSNILDFYPPLHKKEDEAYGSLSVCKCNLLLLENVKTDDILDAVHFIEKLKKKSQNYCILVIAIINTQELDYNLKRTINLDKSISMIDTLFNEVNLQPTIIGFQEMSDKALTECIVDAAKYNNVNLSEKDIEYVKDDLITTESGCKGAYAKVQLVGKPLVKTSSVPS